MKAYFAQPDCTFDAVRNGALCLKMQKRLASARGNAALLSQLKQEASRLACEANPSSSVSRPSKLDRLDRTLAMLRH
ncbi:MAG: hypothetical protein AAFY15_07895 [Cyanobacteria bacterium J06648_11]